MPKLPYIAMFPGDWYKDQVAGCSIGAQGLWWRMIMVMHDASRYGYLCTLDGSPIPPANVAQMCGVPLEQYEALLQELDSVFVPSRTSTGVIFSRRMVRDQRKRDSATERQGKHRSHAPVTPMSQGIAVAVTNSNTKEDKPLPAKRSTQWPDNLRITEMHRMYAITKGVADPDEMWGHFENHHKAKGSRFLDWDRAWFTWVANSKRFGGVRGASQQQKSSEVYVGTGPSLPPDRPPNQKVIERLRKNREAEAARNSGAATGRLEREAGAGARIG